MVNAKTKVMRQEYKIKDWFKNENRTSFDENKNLGSYPH